MLRLQSVTVLTEMTSRSRIGIVFCRETGGIFNEEVFIMTLFTITTTGLVLIGMTGLVMANPAMLPKHPGYPSSGEFANDPGRKNLTYRQSIEEAAKSGDTTMGAMSIDARNTRMLDLQDVDPLKGADEQPVKEGMRILKK
jgi:hypothetical protein